MLEKLKPCPFCGGQVKHDGKMWDIEGMTEKGGQTIVHLKHGDDRAEVGIEELEAEQ